MDFLWRGLVLGFTIAAPVGPIGLLCIQRTVAFGWRHGFVAGLGAATADTFYGAVAALGLSAVSNFLIGQSFWLRLVGGMFLLFLGLRTFFVSPPQRTASRAMKNLWGIYLSTMLLTLANPMTILSFAAFFAGFGFGTGTPTRSGILLIVGVFLGSTCWWLLLSSGAGLLGGRFGPRFLVWINRMSGFAIVGFAVYILIGLWL
jgi:threonine/homoserine/homoserine lactone efflux protein